MTPTSLVEEKSGEKMGENGLWLGRGGAREDKG